MNLVFIYGPPASGKLTVAKELSKLTGYKVFLNHEIIGNLAPLFPYEDVKLSGIRKRLARNIRLEIFGEAAAADINFVTTFGMSGSQYFDFFREVKKVVEDQGGKVLFVQLIPLKGELFKRVEEESRQNTKIDSKGGLEELLAKHPEVFEKFTDTEHLTVDNTNLSAVKVAQDVIDYYKLRERPNFGD